MASTPIGPLVLVVFESIIEVFIITFAGYILAIKGILDKKTQKQMNRVNVSIFTPALLFGKVAFFLTPAKLAQLWVIPVIFVIITVVSAVVALALSPLFKLKRSQRNYSIAAAMFMNSNTLPIALMQSLVVTVPDLKWTSDDTQSAMLSRALTYLVLYSTLGMIVRWSFGVKLLASGDPESEASGTVLNESPTQPTQAVGPSPGEGERILHREESVLTDADDAKTLTHVRVVEEPNSLPSSRPLSPEPQPQASGSGASSLYAEKGVIDETKTLPSENAIPEPTHMPQPSLVRRTLTWVCNFWASFCDFMTVPLWAAFASIVVACIEPLQSFIENHVPPITGAITQMGNCSIPITLVVLGGYFRPAEKGQLPTYQLHVRTGSKAWFAKLFHQLREKFSFRKGGRQLGSSQKANSGENTTIIVVILARMVITPALLLPLLVVATKFNIQRLFQDPVFIVSNVLIIASPPALTLAQITQAASGDAFERLISRTIFWSYVVLTAPSTIIVVVLGLIIAKL